MLLLNPYRQSDMNRACPASDRLSNLPSSLIENILMRLPLLEAARTSILSTGWRYRWTRLPQLVFDFASKINQVIRFLSRNPVEDFTLHSVFCNGLIDKLTSPLFSCQQLKSLNLTNCVLKPPSTFQGFKELTSLVLKNVIFEGDSLTHFISSCPLLQVLYIFNSPTYTTDSLEINNPKLHSLIIEGTFKSISLANSCKLLQIIFIPYIPSWKMDQIKEFLDCLLPVQDLCIANTALTFCKELNGRRLSNLRKLTLAEMTYAVTEFSGALHLICNSPSLRMLHLATQSARYAYDLLPENYLQLLGIKASFNHLHEICIVNFCGLGAELQFLEFLLANSTGLKKVFIYPSCQDSIAKETFMKLLQFTRASPMAKIEFGDPKQRLAVLF